jgi:hypothetical protein
MQANTLDHHVSLSQPPAIVVSSIDTWKETNTGRFDPILAWAKDFDERMAVANRRILDWIKDRNFGPDDDCALPTTAAFTTAMRVSQTLSRLVMDRSSPASMLYSFNAHFAGVSLGADGEIVFEFRRGHNCVAYIECGPEGHVLMQIFRGNKLVHTANLDGLFPG